MDKTTDGPLSGETRNRIYINVHLIMLKCILYNVLRIFLYNVAHLMLKFSLFIEDLSEKFTTTERADLPEQFIQNRCNDYLSADQNTSIRDEKQIELKNINDGVTNVNMNKLNTYCNDYLSVDEDTSIRDDKQIGLKNINDVMNESNTETTTVEINAKDIEKIHNWKMQMITKTLKSNELPTKLKEFNESINNEKLLQEKEESSKKNADSFKREEKHSFKQEAEIKNSLVFTPKKNDFNSPAYYNNQSIQKYDRPINSSKKSFKLNEVYDNVFNLSPEFAIALCISGDLQSLPRNSYEFKFKFGDHIGALLDQNLRTSDVGEVLHDEQYIFYLVVKRRIKITPYKKDFENACYNLLAKMNKYKLTKLVFPKSGLDQFTVLEAKEIFAKVFSGSEIEIYLYKTSKPDIDFIVHPKINTTSKPLWEMEPQTDIIMFINMKRMYFNGWKDEVVENINAKYPFKNRLLEDINIKPIAAGDILTYNIGTELLICIFVIPMNQNPSYFMSLEKAYREMKSLLPGYRYLGIQYVPDHSNWKLYSNIPRNVLLLWEIFDKRRSEIWICGDPKRDRTVDFKLYNKFIQNAIVNKSKRSKTLKNTILKEEEQKCNNNTGAVWSKKTQESSESKFVKPVEQEKSYTDHNTERENWDDI